MSGLLVGKMRPSRASRCFFWLQLAGGVTIKRIETSTGPSIIGRPSMACSAFTLTRFS